MKWLIILLLPMVYADVIIEIVDYEFRPEEVNITVGESVTWLNNATRTKHSVKLVLLSKISPLLDPQATFRYKFLEPGDYTFQSPFLPAAMKGTIHVLTERDYAATQQPPVPAFPATPIEEIQEQPDTPEETTQSVAEPFSKSSIITGVLVLLIAAFILWVMRPKH